MTPTDCLKAGPAELAPIVAEMMGEGWLYALGQPARVDKDGERQDEILECVYRPSQRCEHCNHIKAYGETISPVSTLSGAFRLQERIAELNLRDRFIHWLDGSIDPWHWQVSNWDAATASPLSRTRAACAAYLESKEPARG